MASWTDAIPTFNPYVSQLPVQAMVEVGMQKQKMYEEGVQKIQGYIDKVGGLDVVRDVDKNYLQSKLNELGNNLTMVAAGDFSNFQLVNSVGSMANQIEKDPTVQNAVSSTAWYRKQMTEMEKAISSGKSSIQNQWDFNNKVNDWFNSTDVNRSFRDRYTQYIDVDKKWLEVLKGLHSDLREEDIPYVKNADGSINYNKTAAAMQRVSKETVSAEKIENALRASLSPDELNQLSINGRYQFRGINTPEKLTAYATSKYTKMISENEDQIKQLQGLVNMSTSNPAMKKKAEDAIESLKRSNTSLKSQMDEEMEYILSMDPEEAKAMIYKNGAIAQFARAHAWEHNKSNLLSNPVLEAEHWERNFSLEQSKFSFERSKFSWQQYKDKFDMMMSEKKYNLDVQKQMADLYGISGEFETYLGQNTNVKNPLVAMKDDVYTLKKGADTSIQEIAKSLGTSVGQIETAIDLYNNGNTAEFNRMIPVEWRDRVNRVINDRSKANRIQAGLDKIDADVLSSPDMKQKKANLDKTLSQMPTMTIGGEKFSQKEVLEFINKGVFPTVNVVGAGATMGTTAQITSEASKSKLTRKERLLYDALGRRDKIAEAVIMRYNAVTRSQGDFDEEFNKRRDELILERGGTYIPRLETITFGSGEGNIARRTWESITSNALSKFTGGVAGIPGGEEKLSKDDAKKGITWLSEEKRDNIIYKKLTQGDKTYIVMIKGGEEVMVPLTDREAAQLPVSKNQPSQTYVDVTKAQYLSGTGSTNPTGKYEDSYFNRTFFPNIKSLMVKGDLNWDQDNNAKQYITINLNTDMGVLPLKIDDYPMSRDEAIKYFGTLTDSKIKALYLNSPAIPDDWKEYIKNMK